MNNTPKQIPLPIDKNGALDIKSPIFTPRPGWGGKLKKWLSRHFESRILPIVSITALVIGVYLVFIK